MSTFVSENELDRIAERYRAFATVEADAVSPLYAGLARAVAADRDLLAFLAELPPPKRQPNLLFAAACFLYGTPTTARQAREWLLADPDRLRATMLSRATQTNEPARCAALLPLLTQLPGPLTLIEVGAAAGLCLYPDRYRYHYDHQIPVGPPSPVELACTTTGDWTPPRILPDVVARIGIDLNPLNPADPEDLAWLTALIWPGPEAAARTDRLYAAAAIAAAEPATMLRGDLVERLSDAAAAAPPDSTAVVFHTSVLVYLPPAAQAAFGRLVASLPVHWIAQEAAPSIPGVHAADLLVHDCMSDRRLVLALDAKPLARTAPHGGHIDWLPR
jgi:hypothetical protein